MPEQQSSIKAEISIEPSQAGLPPEVHAIGETRLVSLISNHSAESDVWLGERPDGERVAVKIYRHGRIPGLVDAGRKCSLKHPNLVSVIEAGEVQGRYFEISPFITGGTLAAFIRRRGTLSETEAEIILRQLSEVIHYLHSHHVLHRDIKPTNIFIVRESPLQLALADFGTARLGAYQTMLTGSIGTVAYSSPEAVTGIQSEAADYWSLGTVLLEALTGRQPFDGLDIKQQLYRVASGKIEIPEAIPDCWKALFAGLLRADYTERWRKREIDRWQISLESVATESVEKSPRPSAANPPSSAARENKIPIRGAKAVLLREPEKIQLRATDVGEMVLNRALTTIGRFFWLAFLVDWESHNAWGGIVFLATAAAIGIGIDFLPQRLEQVKREARVNRQLVTYSYNDRRFLRRLVRSWMRSLRRESRAGRRWRDR